MSPTEGTSPISGIARVHGLTRGVCCGSAEKGDLRKGMLNVVHARVPHQIRSPRLGESRWWPGQGLGRRLLNALSTIP